MSFSKEMEREDRSKFVDLKDKVHHYFIQVIIYESPYSFTHQCLILRPLCSMMQEKAGNEVCRGSRLLRAEGCSNMKLEGREEFLFNLYFVLP